MGYFKILKQLPRNHCEYYFRSLLYLHQRRNHRIWLLFLN